MMRIHHRCAFILMTIFAVGLAGCQKSSVPYPIKGVNEIDSILINDYMSGATLIEHTDKEAIAKIVDALNSGIKAYTYRETLEGLPDYQVELKTKKKDIKYDYIDSINYDILVLDDTGYIVRLDSDVGDILLGKK